MTLRKQHFQTKHVRHTYELIEAMTKLTHSAQAQTKENSSWEEFKFLPLAKEIWSAESSWQRTDQFFSTGWHWVELHSRVGLTPRNGSPTQTGLHCSELVSHRQEHTRTTGFFYNKALLLHQKEDPEPGKWRCLYTPPRGVSAPDLLLAHHLIATPQDGQWLGTNLLLHLRTLLVYQLGTVEASAIL